MLLPLDDMEDEERAELLAAIEAGAEDFEQGRHVDGFELVAALKAP
jgi:predicted transcriptional regulator